MELNVIYHYFTGLQWSFLFSLSMAPLQSSHRDWKHGVPGTLISFSLVLKVLYVVVFWYCKYYVVVFFWYCKHYLVDWDISHPSNIEKLLLL